jgi:biotin operon repressor
MGAMTRMLLYGLAAFFCFCVEANADDKLDNLMPVRGFCIDAPRPAELDKFIGFIDKELAPRHVNTLVLMVDYDYQYESHPELRDKEALSKTEVKKLVAVCRKDGIQIIPEIDLLGHQGYEGELGNLLRVYPEFDETPWVKMPKKYHWPNADKLYCKSYCPLQPRVHEVVFALVDELCDVFEANTFHAGMDEVFYIGEDRCPRCGGQDKAKLFADEVRRIDDHLRQHGRTLWIWGDRLLDGKTTGLGEWEASCNDTYRAIDMVPKDVVICDWHYDTPAPTAAYFAIKGFKVITCPWNKPKCAVLQADEMARLRATATPEMKDRFQGMMQTVWDDPKTFLKRDYAGKGKPANAWNCFKVLSDEINKLEATAGPARP